jgi:hypothetical protein
LVKKTAHPSIIFIGVAQKALRLWCGGPSSQTKKKKGGEKIVFDIHKIAAARSHISKHDGAFSTAAKLLH